jgi:hypothetical protein
MAVWKKAVDGSMKTGKKKKKKKKLFGMELEELGDKRLRATQDQMGEEGSASLHEEWAVRGLVLEEVTI